MMMMMMMAETQVQGQTQLLPRVGPVYPPSHIFPSRPKVDGYTGPLSHCYKICWCFVCEHDTGPSHRVLSYDHTLEMIAVEF